MWKYKWQIRLRWLTFVILLIIMSVFVYNQLIYDSQSLARLGLKSLLTELAIEAEFFAQTAWLALFATAFVLAVTGTPSIVLFACFYILTSFWRAYIIIILIQFATSIFSIFIAKRRYKKNSDSVIDDSLKIMPDKNVSAVAFAFFSRVYFFVPLRTIDMLTPLVEASASKTKLYLTILCSIFIRLLIPSYWFSSLLRLISNISVNPQSDFNIFIYWSLILIIYTVIPKIPEVTPCPAKLKPFLAQFAISSKLPGK